VVEAAWDNVYRLTLLVFPAALGFACARADLFEDPARAVRALNVFALYVAFPALVARGLVSSSAPLPGELGFYLVWPIGLALTLGCVWAWRRRGGEGAASMGLVAAFGNVAYLGLPYVEAVMGEGARGAAALAVSIHVVGAVTVGPAVLARWGSGEAAGLGEVAGRLARQPLFWAPFVGLALRALPDGPRATSLEWIGPLAAAAAPVALFMLGVYLWTERARVKVPTAGVLAHLAIRQLAAPGFVLLVCLAMTARGWLSPEVAELHVVLASMPVAITTFAMAHGAGVGTERVAGAIVWSTLLAAASLPAWTGVAAWVFGA
jgi:predicted permease